MPTDREATDREKSETAEEVITEDETESEDDVNVDDDSDDELSIDNDSPGFRDSSEK